ncbi:hypothetical protein ONS96_010667 [Cadophora gregata f. sp. sojae]|nr:hypothetical protein ONS96_010667 [Cadophora gregata f. sp. sojae]
MSSQGESSRSRFSSKLRNVFKSSKKSESQAAPAPEIKTEPKPAPKPEAIDEPNKINESFIYTDLIASKNEIRLVTIEPAQSSEAPIVASLHHASFDDNPQYDALSYTWGSPVDPIAITLNDQTFNVTQGLHLALTSFRLPSAPRTLWIDAVCINQFSIPERNVEVRRMRTIYKRCAHTLIWLGPAFENSDILLEFMAWEDRRLLDPTLDGLTDKEASERYERCMADTSFQHIWVALKQLTELPYWKRMWIVQEVAFGTSPQVCVGSKSCSFWDALIRVLSSLAAEMELKDPGDWANPIWTALMASNMPSTICIERTDIGVKKDPSWLGYTLCRYRNSGAKEPKDKVIALLGFLEESGIEYDEFLTIDYKKPVFELYLEVFKYCTGVQREQRTKEQARIGSKTAMVLSMSLSYDAVAAQEAEATGRHLSGSEIQTKSESEDFMSRAHGAFNIICAAGLYAPPRDGVLETNFKGKEAVVISPSEAKGRDQFPSWLPDWSHPCPSQSIDDLSCNRFKVGGNTPSFCSYSDDNRVITIFGCALTQLAHVSSPLQSHKPSTIDLVQTVSEWYEVTKKMTKKSGLWSPQRFWQTLTFDSYLNRWSTEAPPQWFNLTPSILHKTASSKKLLKDSVTLSNEFIQMIATTLPGRRFALTQELIYAVVPETAIAGDVVVVLWGVDLPVIMRRRAEGGWLLVGECYVAGMMEGGILMTAVQAGMEAEDFEIY